VEERHLRKPVYIKAEVILCDKMFAAVIVNLSEDSVLVEVPVLHRETDCPPDSVVDLRFDIVSCGTVSLTGRIARIYVEETSGGTVTRIGMKIDHIPQSYIEFLKTLE
jgi:hypothetical protein